MHILFIGGTGNISSACVELSLQRGHRVTLLNRGRQPSPWGQAVRAIQGDRDDPALLRRVAEETRYDAVADFACYRPEQVEAAVSAFGGRVGQYVYISSASAYQKPPNYYRITESTPLRNPFWDYSRQKIACEDRLVRAYREEGFPMTIVRPSYTYGPTWIPNGVGGHGYPVLHRMRQGKPIVSQGDGTSLWVMTFHTDFALGFVGLFGAAQAIGEAFHITSDEVLTWDQIYQTIARAAGCELTLVHISSEFIAAVYPQWGPGLLGDKAHSVVFDNSKIKRVVPEFRASVSFAEGIARSIAWHDADTSRQVTNEELDRMWDHLVALQARAAGS